MNLDIKTIIFIQSIVFAIQVIALFTQFRINKSKTDKSYCFSGSVFLALGFITSPILEVEPIQIFDYISKNLIILGFIMIYIGVLRFFDIKENLKAILGFFSAFCLIYFYNMFIQKNIILGTAFLCLSISCVTITIATQLLIKRNPYVPSSAIFSSVFFIIFGTYMGAKAIITLFLPITDYAYLITSSGLTYIILIITSTLWTFGFVIMSNQRLNKDSQNDKEQLEMIFNTSPDATSITKLSDGTIVQVNEAFEELSGGNRDDLIGKSTLEHTFWNSINDRELYINQLKEKGFCKNLEFNFQKKDGTSMTGLVSGRTIIINNQMHIYSIIRDITDRKAIEAALVESESTYKSILNASPDDITITDMAGNIQMVSKAAKKMFGYEEDFDEFTSMKFEDFIVPEDLERAISNIRLMFTEEYIKPNEYTGVRRDGSKFDIEVNSGLVRNPNGIPTKMIIIVRDISKRKQAEKQIQSLIQQLETERNTAQLISITDSLTGLANRRCFDEAFSAEFFRIKRKGEFLSLIMLDVDHFKKYNDIYGHLAGDECLRQIGNILKNIVSRSSDVVARFGGEEFIVILPETDSKGANNIAELIRKSVEDLAITHSGSKTAEYVTISLGVVTVKATEFSEPEQVIALSDKAMYQAKNEGRNKVVFLAGNI